MIRVLNRFQHKFNENGSLGHIENKTTTIAGNNLVATKEITKIIPKYVPMNVYQAKRLSKQFYLLKKLKMPKKLTYTYAGLVVLSYFSKFYDDAYIALLDRRDRHRQYTHLNNGKTSERIRYEEYNDICWVGYRTVPARLFESMLFPFAIVFDTVTRVILHMHKDK